MQRRTISLIFLLLFIVALYVLQNNAVIPLVKKIATSDLFLEKTEDAADFRTVMDDKTDLALGHCYTHLVQNEGAPKSSFVSDKDYSGWHLGGFMYMVKAQIEDDNAPLAKPKEMVCKIRLIGEDEYKFEDWEVWEFFFSE